MSENIIDEIVKKRRNDIATLGFNFGCEIPKVRTKKVLPFIQSKGVILEIKRASPSKGDIAPSLNAIETAKNYECAGASAISVLTEKNYFKGSLKDLIEVSNCTSKACILRKDFLLEEDEIEVSYKCGADAVLLIARILDDKKLVAMGKLCEQFGLTALVELRLQDDLRKLALLCKNVNKKFIVAGVNSRDLSNFKIDLLAPLEVLSEIKKTCGNDIRVIFESGVRTSQAANFVGSLGFNGMLLGEAAARNSSQAKQFVESFIHAKTNLSSKKWTMLAEKLYTKKINNNKTPLLKICGITNLEDAKAVQAEGADFLGFIFCKGSKRNIDFSSAQNIVLQLGKNKKIMTVAVITDLQSAESKQALQLVSDDVIDFVQLHGFSDEQIKSFFDDEKLKCLPHFFAVNVSNEADFARIDFLRKMGEPRILIDSKAQNKIGGTGTLIDSNLVKQVAKKNSLWLAGGINPENVSSIIKETSPELIDVSSGVENEIDKPCKKDINKVKDIVNCLQ